MPTKHADPIFSLLNEPQQEAVNHTKGPLLILAGAGSGKTRALTHRIACLMHDGVPPWQILAVTFTNKAAGEMKGRIRKLLHITQGEEVPDFGSKDGKLPVMGTFHSICARILRRDYEKLGRDRSYVIYDASDQERLMKQVLKEAGIEQSELKPKAVLGYIGRFKCEAVSPKEAAEQATIPRMQQIVRLYAQYQKALREANALDFDDLILETVRLFHEVPEVLDRYQETWRYLHVDEYQDTNHSQYLFITLLAQKYQNLCVIGDPDQSIYAFRGADIRNILEFEKDYPNAKRIKLEQNYRSTQLVLTAADGIIAANPNRPEKAMWSERKEGPKVVVQEVEDERKEAQEAIRTAEELRGNGVPLNMQVILYRTNAQSRLFEEACMRAGIPYRIIGGVKFYARKEVKDVLAYLYVILNPHDTLSLLRILNVPGRKIGQTTIAKIQAYGAENGMPLWDCLCNAQNIDALGEGTTKRIEGFVELVEKLRELAQHENVAHLAEHLLEATDMEGWLRDETEEGETRWQNVQELLSVMHKYDTLDPHTSLTSFLEEVALVSEVDALQDAKDDALTLMTLHLCKGLEFEHVMITGCEEGIFPHSNSMFDREQLEEERRLMYVGMTRAKTHLRMFFARSRMLWGTTQANAPSRFLDDLPEDVIERRSDDILSVFAWVSEKGRERALKGDLQPYRQEEREISVEFNQDFDTENLDVNQDAFGPNTRVSHPSFGTGTVLNRRGDIVDIRFDSGERKSFALSIAPLSPL
ncbi:ATP-dependent DNA helicase PcrA [Candidatus Peregrinibacteria bacterium CG10_big_fil_rev_8_21_14_0_10_55_24]|nr:MAG: ATP-dependent DNA helicase PcrA [Candidatus Peregrinibacteria bacterium CG10_big_fil_rev_8_21_14_0_10_55_24]